MTGLIIVSHSEKLAEGLRDIVMEMNDGSVAVIAAGGAADGDADRLHDGGDGSTGPVRGRIRRAAPTLGQHDDEIGRKKR